MVSLTTTSTQLIIFPQTFIEFNTRIFPSFLAFNTKRTANKREKFVSSSPAVARESGCGSLLGFVEIKRRDCKGLCGCKNRDWDGEFDLEAEILEFMRESEKPDLFPSKKDLVDGGRMDLVEAIVRHGGWLAFGWDLEEEEEEEEEEKEGRFGGNGFDVKNWDLKMIEEECINRADESSSLEDRERRNCGVLSFSDNSSGSASSSGRSLETANDDDSGIEGILSRLEKERNMNFVFGLRERGSSSHVQSNSGQHDWLGGISTDSTVIGLDGSRTASFNHRRGIVNDSGGQLSLNVSLSGSDSVRNSDKPEMWRAWSIQRAGLSNKDLKAAEISSNLTGLAMDVSVDDTLKISGNGSEPLYRKKEVNSSREEINHNQLRRRLQHLELELSSALRSMRSNIDEVKSQKGNGSSSDNYQAHPDAWEFQENEIMNARDKIRSMHAKLAVLEGKMALAIIDAQKMVEEKQKRIDDAHRALRLLRTACIVWPNSASEVLLAGSYDGWSTQRKMVKSSTGIFSLCLKLYPGRYEIKFIVDGEWRVDPLRPIVQHNGFENNLLMIT
ncbi:hypothetical protein CFOL_v3_29893 [Cephalotus follicularis]|uniref:AMP-activated protein kinase glycogen-binding domain-containing protein n=1 Tax=Cephalotus follicularis TaxID=3775 RepID=A0A1Q3D2D5_CEPFO|nr:hypothetical protein CFOL_v3_29893 [Cephalotus follicularis]